MVDHHASTHAEAHDTGGHEPNRVNARLIVTLFAVLTIGIALSLLLMQSLRSLFVARAVPTALPAGQFVRGEQEPPEPRVVEDSPAQLKRLREENRAVLSSYEWVDRENGIVRIPIDRAMELLAQRGLASPKNSVNSTPIESEPYATPE